MKLSKLQLQALQTLAIQDDWKSSYGLRLKLNTLQALHTKRLVVTRHTLGASAFPHNCIFWRITQAGREFLEKMESTE